MVCYVVPLAALMIGIFWRKLSRKKGVYSLWLNRMLLGGALFGLIDHYWNGELFLISANLVTDLALGFTITGGIVATWGFISYKPEIEGLIKQLGCRIGILR
jgi:hypothetical protein